MACFHWWWSMVNDPWFQGVFFENLHSFAYSHVFHVLLEVGGRIELMDFHDTIMCKDHSFNASRNIAVCWAKGACSISPLYRSLVKLILQRKVGAVANAPELWSIRKFLERSKVCCRKRRRQGAIIRDAWHRASRTQRIHAYRQAFFARDFDFMKAATNNYMLSSI